MGVNLDKPHQWKDDVARSVDFYNGWFMAFAPKTYRKTRIETTKKVEVAMALTNNLQNLNSDVLRNNPEILPILRMATAPPLARDRIVGLARVSKNLVTVIEKDRRLPRGATAQALDEELARLIEIVMKLIDVDIFPWLGGKGKPGAEAVYRSATIVADRLCGAESDPIIRNAQEQRQLASIKEWLERRGYDEYKSRGAVRMEDLPKGSFAFRVNVPVKMENSSKIVKIPADTVIRPTRSKSGDLPLLIEAKSAGDFTNVNKRRKEEATKMRQLRFTYGKRLRFVLFLCGYFDAGYLGYEAAEGIDWIWEHRIDDLAKFGV